MPLLFMELCISFVLAFYLYEKINLNILLIPLNVLLIWLPWLSLWNLQRISSYISQHPLTMLLECLLKRTPTFKNMSFTMLVRTCIDPLSYNHENKLSLTIIFSEKPKLLQIPTPCCITWVNALFKERSLSGSLSFKNMNSTCDPKLD